MPKSLKIKIPLLVRPEHIDHLKNEFPEYHGSEAEAVNHAMQNSLNALRQTKRLVDRVENVRKQNQADPTQTKMGKRVQVARYAQKQSGEINQVLSKAVADAEKVRDALDDDINTEITTEAGHGAFANEARTHIQNLAKGKRSPFVKDAIDNEDYNTAAYVLGAPSYLSGLSAEMQGSLKEYYKQKRYSSEINARDALDNLSDHMRRTHKVVCSKTLKKLNPPEVQKAAGQQKKASESMNQ